MVAINLQSISCRPIKTATVTRDRRIATVAVAHNATQKAAKQPHRYAAVLLAGCTAAVIAVSGPAIALDSLYSSGNDNEQELQSIIASRGNAMTLKDLQSVENSEIVSKDKAGQIRKQQEATPLSFSSGGNTSSPVAAAEGPSTATLLGVGAVIVIGGAALATAQNQGELPDVGAAANDAAADAKSALEKVESKTESAVENAADKAKANANDAQSWIAEWRAK